MSTHTYRYLQHTRILPVKQWNTEKGLLGNLELTYMGSAEFEFGAIPNTIARLLTDTEPMVMGKVEVALPKNYLRGSGTVMTTVRYCVRQSQEAQLIELLKNWETASRHFKERNVDLSQSGDFVIVIDKGYECFLWNGKLGKRLLMENILHTARRLIHYEWMEALPEERLVSAETLLRLV